MKKNEPVFTIMSVYIVILLLMVLISSYILPTQKSYELKTDTIKVIDTQINVKNNISLFIGDSHTANHVNGWQVQLCKSTGMKMINASVGGKTTYWMLNQAVYRINNNIDYCFVYGGANDMYSNMSVESAIDNIKSIARICKGNNVKCVILTGFDPIKCTRAPNKSYAPKYSKFQERLINENIEGATVIDTRVVSRSDCWDYLCHMAPSGHAKISKKIIKDLNLKVHQ